MDAKTIQQFEASLIDEFFAMLNQQPQTTPRQLPAPQSEPPRPYYRGPSQQVIDRQRIEAQLRALVEASTAQLYDMLMARLDEMKAQQARQIEAERKAYQERLDAALESDRQARERARNARVTGCAPCTPSRNNLY